MTTTTLYPGVALIVGAASGIGQATAISFAKEGCRKIALVDRNANGLAETEKLMRGVKTSGEGEDLQLKAYIVDVLEEQQINSMIDQVVKEFGRIDYAANCAGILSNNQRSTETSTTSFDLINSVNYRGCWLASRGQLKQMLTQEPLPTHDGRPGNRGSIVNIASQLGIVGRPAAPAYCASKAAVISLTQCDAIDYSKDNIRINCVCPGVIDTPMTRPNMDVLGSAIAIAPMNRAGTAQEVADAVLWLSSSKASFVQGEKLVVDGGYTIN